MKFQLRDLFWLVLVAGIGLAWWLSFRETRDLRGKLVVARERLLSAADAVKDTEDTRELEIKRYRSLANDFAKYELIHPESPPEDTVTVDRKTFDALWAEREFLYNRFNPQGLRVNFHYDDGKITGYSKGGILPSRRVVPVDE